MRPMNLMEKNGLALTLEEKNGSVTLANRNDSERNNQTKPFALERRSTLSKSVVLIVAYLTFEIAKQLGNFSLTTSNGDKMPVPSALLVIMVEVIKLLIITIWAQISKSSLNAYGFTVKFGVPGLCYFITNIIYLHALTITAPPIWIILIQTRTMYTAYCYKVVFKREVTTLQLAGCVFIVTSIFLTRLSELNSGRITITLYLFGISQIAALLSSVASLAVELLLKNDNRGFAEQQFWLYMWGASLAIVALLSTESITVIKDSLVDSSWWKR